MTQTTKIMKLTKKQEARFPEFVDKWIKIGLSTEPANREKSEKAIRGLYGLAKLKEPKVIWIPCPLSGAMSAVLYAYIRNGKVKPKKDAVDNAVYSAVERAVDNAVYSAVERAVDNAVYSAVGRAVNSAVDNAVYGAVGRAVDNAVHGAVGRAVNSAVDSAVYGAVDRAVDNAVYGAVDRAVDSAVYGAVGRAVSSAVSSAVGRAVSSAVGSAVNSAVSSAVGRAGKSFISGSLWAGYSAWADYFSEVLGISIDRNYLDITENCGYYWVLDDVCFASERPTNINLDDQGRLHSETGQSISYKSGWGLYHWHGTKVPGDWIMEKSNLTAKMALTWENMEQRRAACEIVGWAKVLDDLKAKVIDTDDDEEIGELVEVEIPDIGKEKFLRVVCGTGRKFAIPVPPEMKTALDANAWTYDLDGDILKKLEVRT